MGSAHLSQEQFAAIGCVAVEWSHLEGTLRHFVQQVGSLDQLVGLKVTADLSCTQLMNLVLALAHDTTRGDDQQPPLYQHLAALYPTFEELRVARNRIVHVDWSRERRGVGVGIEFRSRGRLRAEVVHLRARHVAHLARRIKSLNQVLWQHWSDWESGRLPALPAPAGKARKRGRRSP